MTTLTLDQLSHRARRSLALDGDDAGTSSAATAGRSSPEPRDTPRLPVVPFLLLPPPRESETCSV